MAKAGRTGKTTKLMSHKVDFNYQLTDERLRRISLLLCLLVALIVPIGCGLLSFGILPSGVPGEWEWQKPRTSATASEWLWAGMTISFYLIVQRILFWIASKKRGELFAIVLLFPIAAMVQVGLQKAAPDTYGLAKWPLCTYFEGSSGYFTVAVKEAEDLPKFLTEYPEWIKKQDCLHIGTHPPGLIVEARLWLDFWQSRPELSKKYLSLLPIEFRDAVRNAAPGKSLPVHEQAALISIPMSHWLLCAATVWPLYLLCKRLGYDSRIAFSTASLWPILPSVVMFQPASDITFGFFAASAIALSISAIETIQKRHFIENCLSGLIMSFGMFLSLVFLPIGLIVAILTLLQKNFILKIRFVRILCTGAGFLLGSLIWAVGTSANPFSIWYVNQQNHGRFYLEYPRSYGKWLVADLAELAFGIGLPLFILAVMSLIYCIINKNKIEIKKIQPMLITLIILAGLALSGKSLSEVSRLWIAFFPLILSGIGILFQKINYSYFNTWILFWTMIQVIWLEQIIQVVYAI